MSYTPPPNPYPDDILFACEYEALVEWSPRHTVHHSFVQPVELQDGARRPAASPGLHHEPRSHALGTRSSGISFSASYVTRTERSNPVQDRFKSFFSVTQVTTLSNKVSGSSVSLAGNAPFQRSALQYCSRMARPGHFTKQLSCQDLLLLTF